MPPPSLQQAAAALWDACTDGLDLDLDARAALSVRCAPMLGGRLAVIAFEMSCGKATLPGAAIVFAELAAGVMKDPQVAMRALLGFHLE